MSKIALTLSIVEELSSEIDDFFLSNFELLIVLDKKYLVGCEPMT